MSSREYNEHNSLTLGIIHEFVLYTNDNNIKVYLGNKFSLKQVSLKITDRCLFINFLKDFSCCAGL